MTRPKRSPTKRTKQLEQAEKGVWWRILNSPIVLLIVSAVIIGGVAKLYTDHQDALRDRATRRTELGRLLSEYQNRLSDLVDADAELDAELGPSPGVSPARRFDPNDRAAVARWEQLIARVSRREADILIGRGDYLPTAPEFAAVNLQVIGTRIDDVAGIPDVQFGGLRIIGILNVRPPDTWLFVRPLLPTLRQFGIARSLLYTNEEIPLLRGASLSTRQERMLGFPEPKSPEELARRRREVSDHLNKTINRLESNETDIPLIQNRSLP